MLQGSLDNFALDEVLGLLAGTSKTGQLDIAGDRGTGSLVFDEGKLVGGTASHIANGTELEDVMFELLRYGDGTFNFDSREVTGSDESENVASVLAAAGNRLRDWRLIEAVVPTLTHQVTPAEELPEDEVTIARSEWAVLTVIAAGCPVSLVCDRLQLGEVEGSRQIKNLAERKLVTVGDPLGSFVAVTGTSSFDGTAGAPDTPALDAAPSHQPAPSALDTPAGLDAPAGFGSPSAMEAPSGLDASGALDAPAGLDGPSAFDASTPLNAPTGLGAPTGIDGQTDGSTGVDAAPLDAAVGFDAALSAAELDADEVPPAPPAPTAADLVIEDSIVDGEIPPAPPSPSEISEFGSEVEDASELLETADTGSDDDSGGLLMRYLTDGD